ETPPARGKPEKTTSATTQPSSSTAHLAHRVLQRPLVTEKSTRGGSGSQYTFEVALAATKADVRQSVRHLYGIAPVAVNIMVLRGKVVRFGRTYGRTADRKKAIVTLPPGKTIDVVSA
ncbi:MAG: 50S ribosomal protein L23, partial [Patescibacteria group bacterium]